MNNNLFRHIEYLLQSHDCVIVPGLGAFIAISHPATIDHDKGVITPPVRSVVFNHAVTSDDGLLANSYVRKHDLTFEEARQVILRATSIIKEDLSAKREVTVGNLGVFSLGEEENLIFTPSERQGKMNEMMGFLDVRFGSDAAEDSEAEDAAEETTYYQFRISKAMTRIAAVFAVLVAVTAFFLINPIPTDDREQRASVVPVEAIIQQTINSDTEAEVADTKVSETIAENNEVEDTAEKLADYYLIIATFSNENEAEKYIAANSTDDFRMELVKSKRMTRVSIAESNDKEELRKQLNSREVLSQYPNAWIWARN